MWRRVQGRYSAANRTNFWNWPWTNKLAFLLLSRPHAYIRDYLGQFESLDLASLPQVKKDVRQYISLELEKLTKLKEYPSSLKEKVGSALERRAEDTFLCVGFTCRELRPIPSIDVLDFLKGLPAELEGSYERVFASLFDPNKPKAADVQRMLTIVAASAQIWQRVEEDSREQEALHAVAGSADECIFVKT